MHTGRHPRAVSSAGRERPTAAVKAAPPPVISTAPLAGRNGRGGFFSRSAWAVKARGALGVAPHPGMRGRGGSRNYSSRVPARLDGAALALEVAGELAATRAALEVRGADIAEAVA